MTEQNDSIVYKDTNGNVIVGNTAIGHNIHSSDYAGISHKDNNDDGTKFGVLFHSDGTTHINSAAGKPVFIKSGDQVCSSSRYYTGAHPGSILSLDRKFNTNNYTYDMQHSCPLQIYNSIVGTYNNRKMELGVAHDGWGVIQCSAEGEGYFNLYLNYTAGSVIAGTVTVSSDDRLKINEEYITNGLEIINKLKPQIYDKLFVIDDINKLKNNEINDKNKKREAGFIAQEIYYSIPELKHIVNIQENIIPDPNIEIDYNDPQKDPDYSTWGEMPASINYIELIPYLANAIQELSRLNDAKSHEINELKTENQELKEKIQSIETENAQLKADMALIKQKLGL